MTFGPMTEAIRGNDPRLIKLKKDRTTKSNHALYQVVSLPNIRIVGEQLLRSNKSPQVAQLDCNFARWI